MAAARARVIADLLTQHVEEIDFLWNQRQNAWSSSRLRAEDVVTLDERIEAHLQGLLVAGDLLLPIAMPYFTGGEPGAVFAIVYALLRSRSGPAAELIATALEQASGPALLGFADALRVGPLALIEERLIALVRSGPPAAALVAAEGLAYQGKLTLDEPRLKQLCGDAEPAVRLGAWRVLLGLTSRSLVSRA